MDTGQLLIITGSTGSGKTTTCKTFVDQADELWLHFGADQFLGGVLPRKYVDGGSCAQDGLRKVLDDPTDPDGPRHLEFGRYGLQIIDTFHAMVAAGVRAGSNLVIDHITTLDPPLLQSCIKHFRDLPVFFVALKPPQNVIPERLDNRLDKIVSALTRDQAAVANANTKRMAEFLYRQIFSHDHFDRVIDSNAHDPNEVVTQIVDSLAHQPRRAFTELARRFDAGEQPFNRH